MRLTQRNGVQAKGAYIPVSERDYVSDAQILDRAPEKIKQSSHSGFYVNAIRAGWGMQQLSDYALKYFGESISRESFRRLRNEMSPDMIIDPTYRESVLKDIDVKIEALVEIQNLIAVQRQRVTEAIAFERKLATDSGSGVIPLRSTSDEIALLHEMLTDLINVQVEIGVFQKVQI